MYEYRAKIVSVYDGDTVKADIDLGMSVWLRNTKLRLAGIDAPELHEPGGHEARDWLRRLVGEHVTIRTIKDRKGKYGRYLAQIILSNGIGVNALMIKEGYAKKYDA